MPRHRKYKIKDSVGVVSWRLHHLLDALRHFKGGERSLGELHPIEGHLGAIMCRGSVCLISGATLRVW